MTVDAHHHVWDLSVRDQDWIRGRVLAPLRRNFTLADLAPEAAAAGVDRTVLVQTVTVPEETPELLALAHERDERHEREEREERHGPAAGRGLIAGVVGWTDLTRPDVAEELARLRALPGGRRLKGVRHQVQGEADPEWLLRPDVRRGLAAVADAGLVYDLVVLPHQLPACAGAARALPGLTFVLDHAGKPPVASGSLDPWARDLRTLAALPNTVCKLSGLVTEADPASWTVEDLRPYADTVLEAFGPGRLMYGSDWPVSTLAADYGEVLSAAHELTEGLSGPERTEVFEGTAVRVYGL